MPTIDREITRTVVIETTPRLAQMAGMFDCPLQEKLEQRWHLRFELAEPWNIGVIVGPSGCGKTTIAKELFGRGLVSEWSWATDRSLLDGFPPSMGIREIVGLLSSVGFSSPPGWCKPFAVLSTGEQFRVHLARTLAEAVCSNRIHPVETPGANASGLPVRPDESGHYEPAVIDEFTSVVDRTVARIGSAALAKTVRQRNQKVVLVTCHYDVLDWLTPDWVCQPATGDFQRRSLRPRPRIELEIAPVRREAWRLFRDHHYLSGALNPTASRCYAGFVFGQPAAFVAVVSFPHPTRPGWREHRLVCLPDFQGVGIGNAMSRFVAGLYAATGKPYRSVTSHPAVIGHRVRSPDWKLVRKPSLASRQTGATMGMKRGARRGEIARRWAKSSSCNRLTASFEYIGPPRPTEARAFGLIGRS